MKRRRGRRGARRSPLPIVVLLVALAVLAVAVALIVRGDTTPRPRSTARHRHHASAATQLARTRTPPAADTETPQRDASAASTATPLAAATEPPPQAEPRLPAPPSQSSTTVTAPTANPSSSASAPTPAAAPAAPGASRLAIIIDDCGQWPETERGFIALPVALTLSVLPHVRFGSAIARDAQAAGKGVMLHLPMEPRSGIDPGPGRITVAMDDAAIEDQVRDDLASVPLALGVNNHEGSRATADDRVMRAVASVLAQRHVFFIDSRTTGATVAERDANAAGIPTARRDVFLDDVADVDATEAQLRTAADLARARGSAIAIGHPRPTTLIAVRALLPELQRSGVTLVLASDLVR